MASGVAPSLFARSLSLVPGAPALGGRVDLDAGMHGLRGGAGDRGATSARLAGQHGVAPPHPPPPHRRPPPPPPRPLRTLMSSQRNHASGTSMQHVGAPLPLRKEALLGAAPSLRLGAPPKHGASCRGVADSRSTGLGRGRRRAWSLRFGDRIFQRRRRQPRPRSHHRPLLRPALLLNDANRPQHLQMKLAQSRLVRYHLSHRSSCQRRADAASAGCSTCASCATSRP